MEAPHQDEQQLTMIHLTTSFLLVQLQKGKKGII